MTDFLMLLQRDHRDLEAGLDELLAATTVVAIRSALDGVRLGLTAHAEAEDIVLHHALVQAGSPELLDRLIGQARSAHLAQEGALGSLVCARPGSQLWKDRARKLRDLVHMHAHHEEKCVVPAIRELAPAVYETLAGSFATERLRQLAMLVPSAPIRVPEMARAC
ncbi:MAG TPA: hemerythrin domain-containing protein [Kofleriaceae bacterium]